MCCTLSNCFVGSETPKHKAFDQFWKFNFPFKHFPSNTRSLSFDRSSNYLYLFNNHRQTGERPSPTLRLLITSKTFHDGGRYHIETSPLIWGANQWTGFYMITASVIKALNTFCNLSLQKGYFLLVMQYIVNCVSL